jgi:heme/copper-type cytochrome/quinol oxidase subunit 2
MTCPRCQSIVADAASTCPQCGLDFRPSLGPAYRTAPGWAGPVVLPRSVQGLGIALYALFALLIVTDVVTIWLAMRRRALFELILTTGDWTFQELDRSDEISEMVALFQFAVYVAVLVVWLVWFYRAYVNAELYGLVLRYSKGWAIGAWFAPFLNVLRPKEIADDIARASDPDVPFSQRTVARLAKHPLITVWWVAYLIDIAGSQLWSNVAWNEEPGAQPTIIFREIVMTVIDIVAAVLAVLVVRLITHRQEQKNNLMAQQVGRPAGQGEV